MKVIKIELAVQLLRATLLLSAVSAFPELGGKHKETTTMKQSSTRDLRQCVANTGTSLFQLLVVPDSQNILSKSLDDTKLGMGKW